MLDWGYSQHPAFGINANGDHGLIIEVGLVRRTLGFRRDPYEHRMSLTAGLSTDGRFVGKFSDRYPSSIGRFDAALEVSVSGVRRERYFGVGNNTPSGGPANFHRVDRYVGVVSPTLSTSLADNAQFSFGPLLKLSDTSDDGGRIIDGTEYGAEFFAQAGAEASLDIDTRTGNTWRTSGVHVFAHWSGFAGVLDVRQNFWELDGQAAGYLPVSAPLHPVLAARVAAFE